ncbi:MAG TPA: nicotinate-nucleotide diphosphorylase (carboxylating), partial [Streptosporangiaceae bacterium]|nr:nicotinate-nucleotide diphosphorylase (carboxylating) [Streptosporangiaceae bacterium]
MKGLSAEINKKLMSSGLDPADVERVIRTALAEDLHLGPDVTTLATIPEEMLGEANVVARAPGVIAGL